MPHKGDVKAETAYSVKFIAQGANTGTTSVTVGFTPKDGTDAEDLPSGVQQVAPNGVFNHADTVPALTQAFMLQVRVQGVGKKGTLTVVNGGTTVQQDVTADTIWAFDVI